MNYKNFLQEMCMKTGLHLPKYQSESTSEHGLLEWKTTLEIFGKKFKSVKPNKKEGEQEVARQAFLSQNKKKEETTKEKEIAKQPSKPPYQVLAAPKFFDDEILLRKPSNSLPPKIAVIIDLENLPKFPQEVKDLVDIEGLSFFSVCSKHYHSVDTFDVKGIEMILSPTMGQNASDICMMTLIGSWLAKETYGEYVLVSRDKFVVSLKEIISQGTEPKTWVPKPCVIISSKGQLEEYLEELGLI
jgi:hypothetical protein